MKEIYTIGHSTHSMVEFMDMLKSFEIEVLVDVRSYPGSRHVPQFNRENMRDWITENGLRYAHIPELGGRRRQIPGIDPALIGGWKHIAFRNYSAYTLTEQFDAGLSKLIEIAGGAKTCIMCAESVPWKCHRLLISNSLTIKGFTVKHIIGCDKVIVHELGRYGATAVFEDGRLTYPKTD